MGTISRQTTWSTGDTLTASDINGEFDNILSTANGSLNADNLGVTAGQAAASKAIVLDSNKDFADTSSGNQIRNLTISGSLKIGTTFLPDASGGADLGSTALEWGDVYIADDKKIYLGSDQDISLQYDETTNNALEIAAAVEGAALGIVLKSDQGDDAGDEWKLNIADGGTLTLGNDIASAGTYVTHLTLTPNSTVSSSTLALAGALTVAGTASITGVATVGGITIGSAVINEAELETIDGITAGTVAASKAVVVDSNKDIGTFRNVTIDGTFSDGNYTFDTSGNVSGLGTIGSGAITSTGVVTATGFTIGSAVINEAELETIDGVTAGTVAASKAVVVDSNKDIASFRNVTLTGELDAATLDISGNADIDGTTNLDAVDIDGAVQVDATITVGADDQGYDIIFYGDAASANMTWDTSADDLILNGGAGLIVPDGQLTLGSTALAATAAELNVLDGVTAGTVAASKGVVVDANKDIGSFRNVTLTGELDAATLDISGNADIDGTTNLDAVDIDGAVQVDATIAVGVDDTGYDVKFFGATSGSSLLWDESADDLILTNAGLAVGSDATGDIYYRDANGFLARLAIGSDGQVLTSTGTVVNWEAAGGGGGGDFSGPGSATDNAVVRFNGTGGKTGQNSGVTIDDSNNATGFANLTLSGELDAATLDISGNADIDGTTNLDAVDIDGAVQIDSTVTVGVDDTGHDVTFFGASAGAKLIYDQSEDTLEVRGPSADATTSTGKLKLTTALTDINDGDVLGRIDFAAPLEAGGTDAILAGAAIWAEADATFAADNNSTELVFATNTSAAATERMRINSSGHVGIGVVPTTWLATYDVLQLGGYAALSTHQATDAGMPFSITQNANLDTDGTWEYIIEDEAAMYQTSNGEHRWYTAGSAGVGTDISWAEKFKVDNNGSVVTTTTASANTFHMKNSHGSAPYGIYVQWTGASPDGSGTQFLTCSDSTTARLYIYGDGDVANHDGTYGTISDVKIKQDIADMRSYWGDFKSLQYRKYRHKSDVAVNADAPYRIGLVAQEVESVFPSLVQATPDRESQDVAVLDDDGNAKLDADGNAITEEKMVDLGTETKWVKSSIIEGPIMASVVQELQARLEAAETKIAALEAA